MSDWKLVPAYPTQAMDDAGERAVCDSYDSGPSMTAFRAYVAMVEAAPEAPPKINPTHEAADAFWQSWKENGETHKHGYYESTWKAINAALKAAGLRAKEST